MSQTQSILIVDDSLNDVELVLNALKRNNFSHKVATARDGGEALDYLFRRGACAGRTDDDPLFILLDLKMPRVDGLEVLRSIKADERLKLIPVVMLTSSSEVSDLIKTYRLGVNAYVVKPVDFTEFVEAIRHVSIFWSKINRAAPLAAVG
jgi:CheY-like chemotaxis protein